MAKKQEGLTKEDYAEAIFIQNGCNLSGIVHGFSRVVSKIWHEANKHGHGTDWVNTHPISVLYADKIKDLSTKSEGSYFVAMDYCKKKALS